jgi:poly(3-hydroxybutyrate) depolymerase
MDPTVQAQGFYRIETVQTPQGNLNNTTLSIEQTWSQEPNGFERTADVIVPVGSGPHPVVIMLHGNGGDSGFIQSMGTTLNNAIRVAPNGYLKSWNVDNEASKAPDVAFIRELINLLRSYDNVDAGRISIFGSSNGSGMTNRLLIELDGAAFQRGAGRVSQMITKMYHDGSFWYNSNGDNSYNEPIVPASGRRILMISGDSDPLIPYTGGNGVGTTFMDAQESIYRLAQAMGETGTQINDADGVAGNLNDANPNNDFSAAFIRYSYLGGQVVHFKLIGGDHGLDVGGSPGFSSEANQMIADFLLD